MRLYRYRAIDQRGILQRGNLSAQDKPHLELILSSQKKELIHARPTWDFSLLQKKTSSFEMIEFCIQLQSLLHAKVPLLETLKSIHQELALSQLKQALDEIILEVDSGKPLSQSLEAHPKLFDDVFISLIQIGEETGKLDESLGYLVEHVKWQESFRSKSKKALTYPLFLSGVIGLLVVILFSTLVPQMTTFFETMDLDLPLITRLLVGFSEFLAESWVVLSASLAVCSVGVLVLSKLSKVYNLLLNRLKLKLPLTGKLNETVSLMRYFHVLSVMMSSHVEILRALKVASQTVENLFIKEKLEGVQRDIRQGQKLSVSISQIDSIPNFVHRMIKVGEQSGDLITSFKDINYFYDREVEQQTSRMLKLLEPSMLIVMGGLIAWIALAIFYPLYDSLTLMEF